MKKPVALIVSSIFLCTTIMPCIAATKSQTPQQLKARVQVLEKENRELKAKLQALTVSKPAFQDLADVTAYPLIDELARLGLFNGMGESFHPFQPITRGEYIAWLYNAYNKIVPQEKRLKPATHLAPFYRDVPASHPAYKYVQALSNAGYTLGYEDGTFRPDQPLTREEMLGIKLGVDIGKNIAPDRMMMNHSWKFSDGSDVDERYTGYIYADYGIFGPQGKNIERAFGKIGAFRPKQPVLRAEAAATLWQVDQFGYYTAAVALKRNNP